MTWRWNAANTRWESGHWWITSQTLPWDPCSILYWHEDGSAFATSWKVFSGKHMRYAAVEQAERWEAEGYRPEPITITVESRGLHER